MSVLNNCYVCGGYSKEEVIYTWVLYTINLHLKAWLFIVHRVAKWKAGWEDKSEFQIPREHF